MAFPSLSSVSGWKIGFWSALLFYALGLVITVGLAQVMPVADMCNPGLPFFTGLLTLVFGACGLIAALLALLFGYRPPFLMGFIAANVMVLVGPALLILV
ncbi:hypothetical protein Q5H92_13445 [Hymenobacter sp. M29]|uniref:Major facilitator superfamily (MFS) profile domain-containing protein n=1 Tax=Hymenobacter mellowenesis TaxID=3063995 RepID=A0ABT9ACV3_9BACT|nr:hypothetical protein [Hymenobacter sp. M29]MDO7847368.1 hypothetical protein [Hymenobacter sp. M29]